MEQILTDTKADQVSHLVISEGVVSKERKMVPVQWVSSITEGEFHLAVGPRILDSLPTFQ